MKKQEKVKVIKKGNYFKLSSKGVHRMLKQSISLWGQRIDRLSGIIQRSDSALK